jgi:hypothetical protein
MKLVIFCEAAADFRTASALVDRVLHEEGPAWIADLLPSYPESIRTWMSDGPARDFFDVHKLDDYRRDLKLRFQQGHFDGKPGAADAQMGRNVFCVARELHKRELQKKDPSPGLAAVFLVRDMDDQGDERRTGLVQARNEAARMISFPIVLGCADRMREAWVLAGFEPESPEESARLDDLRQELGFAPCDEAHQLDAKDEQAKRSPKRVVGKLVGDDFAREERCWKDTPLPRLSERGEHTGLRAFLAEVREHVVPLFARARGKTSFERLVEEDPILDGAG